MLKKYSLKALQTAINQGLQLDSSFKAKMSPLHHKWLEIVIEPLDVNFYMGFDDAGIVLESELKTPADTIIHSSPLGLIRLSVLPASKARSLFNDSIHIDGDVELGQAVKRLFDEIDIDWEGHLAQFTGDIIAHQIGGFWRRGRAFGQQMLGRMQKNIDEYLHEELRVSPGSEEFEDFCKDIDTLSMDIERIEAKLKWLVIDDKIN